MSSNIFSLRVAATNSDEAVPVACFPYIDKLILRLAGYHFPSSHSARLLPIDNPSHFSPSGLNLKFFSREYWPQVLTIQHFHPDYLSKTATFVN